MRALFILMILGITCGCVISAPSLFMPLKDVRSGMQGYGLTVFENNRIERFEFEVIDIIYNYRPQRDIIIIKLLGEKPTHTGIVSGMSGSPIYLEGKLAGALAYRLGSFMKEPLAGVTPIEQMLEIFSKEQNRAQELSFSTSAAQQRLRQFVTTPHNDPSDILQLLDLSAETDPFGIRPIELPLFISGLSPALQQQLNQYLSASNCLVLTGGRPDSLSIQSDEVIGPGSSVASVLVSGDFDISAIGTVTFRDGNRLLAFGHPFFNSGPVNLPLAQTKILTTLSSLYASNKLGMATKIIGNIRQDRSSGIMAVIGELPPLIPVNVLINLPPNEQRQFHFNLANDRSLAAIIPVFLWITLINSLESARLGNGDYALQLTGRIQLDRYSDVILDNFYSGGGTGLFDGSGSDIPEAAYDIVMSLATLLANEFEMPTIKAIDLQFSAQPGQKLAQIEQVYYSKEPAIPGDNMEITVVLRPYRADRIELRHRISIPQNIHSNSVILAVGCSDELKKWDGAAGLSRFSPASLNELILMLNRKRKNSDIIIQLRVVDSGAVLHGREFPTLPPSVYETMINQKNRKTFDIATEKVIREWIIPTEMKIRGGKRFALKLEAQR